LEYETYSERTHPTFARIVESTYEGTLDCPALARIRSGELMLEAHRSTGRFCPEACRLYRRAGNDVGILLLAEHPDRNVWEVAYLGVVPAARGQGFGRAILASGIQLVQPSGRPRMEIAVDLSNDPALRIYHGLGFTDERRYAVHLRFRPQSNTAP
jgi:ribosomal protein S18 acetylase RimI-like enzyme